MATIFFFGHGGWDPRNTKTGFTSIPAGTSFKFYTEANALMTLGFGLKLIRGEAVGPPDQEFGAYRQCPDMTLHPAPEFHGQVAAAAANTGATVIVANKAIKISSILDQYKGNDIVWIACRALEMKETKRGAASGINRVGR